jgi:flagellar biosynthesis/type III secretory pathway M-ring protein FliF/YscJ
MILQTPMPPIPPMPSIPLDPNTIGMIVVFSLVAATIILWPIVRALARRLEGKGPADAGLKAEVEQLHQRLGDVDALQARVAELEERLDFTERMLARTPEAPTQLHRGDVP